MAAALTSGHQLGLGAGHLPGAVSLRRGNDGVRGRCETGTGGISYEQGEPFHTYVGVFRRPVVFSFHQPNSASATNLNVSLSCVNLACTCSNQLFEFGAFGGPAFGSANFDPVAPGWSLDFGTENAIARCDEFGNHGLDLLRVRGAIPIRLWRFLFHDSPR